ncbi:rod shape-determining protein MreD [Endozoicomonas sp. OPT23]|uniref:rod shape-determining protein MreD n=1 Tax=Endozoicomonas sp. OPT23 TaxID=2072845 RepID=UPI00129A97B3|nr:rod shape-determining protein MreD [Endozoicomonas sp. OPT23]MRI32260.1 rod shape-determining protein MreD [Endozoicomonas sp. OPT23]
MSAQRTNGHWIVWASIAVALLLSILPLPDWVSISRPAWVAMVVMYWIMALPERFGLFFAFVSGLMMDVFMGTGFGHNSLGLLVVAAVVLALHRRLRMFPWWQQAFMAFVIIGLYQLVNLWIKSALGRTPPSLWYLMPALTSAAFWPWLSLMLRYLRRYYRVR